MRAKSGWWHWIHQWQGGFGDGIDGKIEKFDSINSNIGSNVGGSFNGHFNDSGYGINEDNGLDVYIGRYCSIHFNGIKGSIDGFKFIVDGINGFLEGLLTSLMAVSMTSSNKSN